MESQPNQVHSDPRNEPPKNTTNPQFPFINQTQPPRVPREFTPIGEPLSSILSRLSSEGIITPLGR
jgi:hypothetical protein